MYDVLLGISSRVENIKRERKTWKQPNQAFGFSLFQ